MELLCRRRIASHISRARFQSKFPPVEEKPRPNKKRRTKPFSLKGLGVVKVSIRPRRILIFFFSAVLSSLALVPAERCMQEPRSREVCVAELCQNLAAHWPLAAGGLRTKAKVGHPDSLQNQLRLEQQLANILSSRVPTCRRS